MHALDYRLRVLFDVSSVPEPILLYINVCTVFSASFVYSYIILPLGTVVISSETKTVDTTAIRKIGATKGETCIEGIKCFFLHFV